MERRMHLPPQGAEPLPNEADNVTKGRARLARVIGRLLAHRWLCESHRELPSAATVPNRSESNNLS